MTKQKNNSATQKEQVILDFRKTSPSKVILWIKNILKKDSPDSIKKKEYQLSSFGKYFLQLPKDQKYAIWKLFNDKIAFQYFRQLIQKEKANQLLDIGELIGQIDKTNKKGKFRSFSFELSTLMLDAILNNRGSLSNQKAYITKLFKDWANAHSISFKELSNILWPFIWKLAPGFQHHNSINIFSKILQKEINPEKLNPKITNTQNTDTVIKKENNPYRKLWDKTPKKINMDEIYTIQNAGLALLWPYFNVLFERAELKNEEGFINEEAQQKAVFLLEYIANKNTAPGEHELIFNKILCGIPIDTPIDLQFNISDSLQELCDGLITAAIGHWEIIGDISIDSFRETFLQRDGTIGQAEEFWQLKVEPKTYDVLLKQLPWGIATINLSWMELIIKVEWE